jgi:glycosyltransferase involved in cell wall biosynthesis/precorrin-6B methylase 2
MRFILKTLFIFCSLFAFANDPAQGTLDQYLEMHGFHLSPVHSRVNEGYVSAAQKEQFRQRLKLYPHIQTIAEIGLNAGHSAENFFLCCSGLKKLVSFDFNQHAYTAKAVEYFRSKYQDRFEFVIGDSLKKVPEYARRFPSQKFDLIYIDGSHTLENCLQDIENCQALAHADTLVWVDDYNFDSIFKAVAILKKAGFVDIIGSYHSNDSSGGRYWAELRYIGKPILKKTICLNMIVKNEKDIIEGCLASIKGLIDYWVIVDTGSDDGTQAVIRECMKDIPGELHERPWVNFAHNRNEALALAKQKADYTLFIDADERWAFSDAFSLPELDKDYYRITVREIGVVDGVRKCLINNRLKWRWEGVLHEVLVSDEACIYEDLKEVINLNNTVVGSRTKDPRKYHKDAEVLEQALKEEPNNSRYIFYLAQCHANAGQYARALENYQKRAAIGEGRDRSPEVFWSLYCIGRVQEELSSPTETIISSYSRAHQLFPERAEPLYRIAELYCKNKNYFLSYEVSKYARALPEPQERAFVETWIYEFGILTQFANSAYCLGRFAEAREAIEILLKNPRLNADMRNQLQSNLKILNL